MVPASGPMRDPAAIRPRTWLMLAVVTFGAAALYLDVRAGVELVGPGFGGMCERITHAGLTITSQDWMCVGGASRERSLYLAASLAVGIGLAWPPVVLAATGRRSTAFLPLVPVVGGVTVSIGTISLWNGLPTSGVGVFAAVLDLSLLAAPAAAVAYAVRRRPRARGPDLGWLGRLIAAGVWVAGTAAILIATRALFAHHFGSLGFDPFANRVSAFVPAALVMGLFGALLGSERRWWPWSLVPPAVLLSLGPSIALLSLANRPGFSVWSPFGAAVPLFLVGLAATWWRPMAVAISTWLERSEASDFDDLPAPPDGEPATDRPDDGRRFRRVLIPNAIAAGLLAVSVVIFVADPYPVTIAEPIPLYLGLRRAAQDLRVRTDLHQAMAAMTAYRSEHGSDEGFDPASGPALAAPGGLPWLPSPATDRQMRDFPPLTMSVVRVAGAPARIVAFSESGRAFCVQRSRGGQITFGSGGRSAAGIHAAGAWHAAVAGCGEHEWMPWTLAPLPVDGMCDGVSAGYLICRATQVAVAESLQAPADAP